MRADVKVNDLWMFAIGWLREEIDFPTPQSQTNTVVVPGRNAPIRFTEALGRVSYQPRSFSMCAEHGTNLTGESPVTGIYHQV